MNLINTYKEAEQSESIDFVVAAFMSKVYGWMSMALLLTALTAWTVSKSESLLSIFYGNDFVFLGLFLGELGLIWLISAALDRLSVSAVTFLFIFCALLNGAILAFIFSMFTTESIASTFLVTAITFGAMSLVGIFTKKDLSKKRNILLMALLGVIIATGVNLFLANTALAWIITYAGVLIFVGLTAYDTQKLRKICYQIHDERLIGKIAISGALILYLDFVNLFLYLLQMIGHRRY